MKEIRFVDVGEGITEGHIQKWLVNDGDAVKEDQPIFQVETDKAVVNMPSPIDGYVRIVAKADTTVHLGDLVAQIGTKEELAAAQKSQPQQQAAPQQKVQQNVQQQPQQQSQQAPKEIVTTPYVRKLAKDLNVDISKVMGTGPNGRILENDVRSQAAQTTATQKPVPNKFSETLEEQHKDQIERMPMSQTRKAIARNMEATLSIPSAAHMDLINTTNLFNLVSTKKPDMEKKGIHLTFLPFIIKATVAAIKENPNFNSSYDHEKLEIIRKNYYNIGLAAEGPDGLKVAVVKDADKKTIEQIAKEIQELGDKVKNRQ